MVLAAVDNTSIDADTNYYDLWKQ